MTQKGASKQGMRYLVLASDYDGTLASQGKVDAQTMDAVDRLLDSGRKFILVTGRQLDDLKSVFPQIERCHLVVAENGGLLYKPATHEERSLAEPPHPAFLAELSQRGVPFSVGRGIVATWEPHQKSVLETIKSLGLELQVSFNKGAVMVLPSGINKQSGLQVALKELCLSPHNVVGIGDAENDHVFLSACECAVAVANALPSLKERADIVTQRGGGEGVAEVIEQLLQDDLACFDGKLKRFHVVLGTAGDKNPISIPPSRGTVLLAGPSGSGKSTAVNSVLEQLADLRYQFCLIDPEGDYDAFAEAVQLGTSQHAPDPSQVIRALEEPEQKVIVSLLGVPLADRPLFFTSLFLQILELRARAARPHWVIVDEAHHMLPSSWLPATDSMPQTIAGLMLITVHPESISPAALQNLEVTVAVGSEPDKTLTAAAKVLQEPPPQCAKQEPRPGEAMVWLRGRERDLFVVKLREGKPDRRRHLRKYAQGDLGPDRSFYFRGPENKLNLRAQNLEMFNAIAEGIDDDTWLFHFQQGDYSRWLREFIKDASLAEEVAAIERGQDRDAASTRAQVKAAIDKRYTKASL